MTDLSTKTSDRCSAVVKKANQMAYSSQKSRKMEQLSRKGWLSRPGRETRGESV